MRIIFYLGNLLEYSENYSMTLESLWNYYRDEMSDDTNENNDPGKTTTSKHKTISEYNK